MGFFAEIIQKGPFSGDFEKFPKNRLSEMDSKGLSQVTWMLNTPEKLGFRAFSGGGNNFHFSKTKPFSFTLIRPLQPIHISASLTKVYRRIFPQACLGSILKKTYSPGGLKGDYNSNFNWVP